MDQTKKKETEVGNKLSDFEIIKELGKGSYGTVYTVKSLLNSNIYVMKKMEINHLKHRQQQECYREVSILKKVSHRNIIKYYSSFLENEILYIIMEYAELGDLYSLIKHYKKHSKYFEEIDLWKISSEILSGLEYLHSQKIIHRDIKCLNLFITKDRHIKIGDLGVSTITSGIDNLHYTRVGTPLYISPELVKQKPYDYKTDIWSFGCSLYHLASLEPPFTGGNLIVLGNNIVKGVPKSLPYQYSNELRAFIDKMLEKNPENRPSAKEALEMIPKEIKEKISVNGEKFCIKSKRPFSSAMNKVIAVNKDEIRNLFGYNNNIKLKNKNKKDIINSSNRNENCISNKDNNAKNNLKHIFSNNNSSGNIITIRNLEEADNNKKDIINNENRIPKENELKINENKKREFQFLFNSNDNDKAIHRNINNNIDDLKYDSVGNSNNELKKSKNISVDTPSIQKKKYDLSFNFPSFNNQKGFNIFRSKKKKSNELLLDHKYNLGDKFNLNYNYLKIFSPVFKNSNNFFDIKKSKKRHFVQKNVIEPNKNQNIINSENKINIQNTIKDIIQKNKNKENKQKTESNINMNINYEDKNINIININNKNNIANFESESNIQNKKQNNLGKEKKINDTKLESQKAVIRANTEIHKNKSKDKLKFPELSVKDKTLENYIKKSNFNNNVYSFMNQNLTNLSSNRSIYKRLTSAKPNSRSISNNRPFTSKINKNPRTFGSPFNFNNDTFNNIIKQNNMLFYTKASSTSDSHRNYSENKNSNVKKMNFRPMTGIKPQINNNVMNININFYNIDMNKRFLIPEINPYYSSNENGNGNNMEQFTDEDILQTRKCKENIINNMDLQSYKNSNEFLFEKIIKAIKDINGNNKRLTINDLK